MKFATASTAAIAGCAAAVLAGCSGASHGTAALPTSVASESRANPLRGDVLATGVDTRFSGPASILSRLAHHHRAKVEKDLFVSDEGSNVFELKNGTYNEAGDITSGVSGSDGVFVDKKGNVYVANVTGPTVTEYKKGHGSPICTYSSGLVDPINVTVDDSGNVFVADFNKLQDPGFVDEFGQCGKTIKKQFDVSSGPEGVAVDKSGDLFVSYFGAQGGNFEEFKAGSSSPTPLGISVTSPAGLILDKKSDLILDDQEGNLFVSAPPYTSLTTLASNLDDPFHCSLNQKENLLFNANHGSGTVTVYSYPSGTLETTIDSSNGIDGAEGVGESPDAIF
ncbi:MAG: hypothetical protein WCB01_17070 [Candidatus Cybelea sp.]